MEPDPYVIAGETATWQRSLRAWRGSGGRFQITGWFALQLYHYPSESWEVTLSVCICFNESGIAVFAAKTARVDLNWLPAGGGEAAAV
jgi:hypothetical protein